MRARAGWGQAFMNEIVLAPSLSIKKSFAKKIFGLNLTLHTREARGIAIHQWFSLARAKENFNKIELSTLLVCLYTETRTYFTKNPRL